MVNSLRKRFGNIYAFLVLIILFIGGISTLNIYRLKNSINGLISNNYKSISSINEMVNCVNNQDKAILIYLQGNKEEALNIFHTNDDEFYKWFYIEKSNMTEIGESEIVDEINFEYIEFSKLFSSLQDTNNGHNHEQLVEIYKEEIYPQVKIVIEELKSLSKLNEDMMFDKKELLRAETEKVIYLIFSLSLVTSLIGGIIAKILSDRLFKPINLLIDSISDPILVLDKKCKVKFINNNGKKYFDIKDNSYKNKKLREIIALEDVYEFIQNSIKDEKTYKVIEFLSNEKKLYFNLNVSIIKTKDKNLDGIVLLFKDITDLKEIEIVKRNFIGTVSHELKTPLTSIMMGIGLINNENIGVLNHRQKDIVETISEDVHNLSELVSNLLKISEIQGNNDNFHINANDIAQVMEEVVENFKHLAKEKNILLDLSVEEKLPWVMIDREKIKWVLNNLISNAIRYTEEGMVKIEGSFDGEKVYIYVTDTGRGIPREYLKKVFEKFVRVEGFEIPEESTGLGLAIAKEIVEIHGGKIWCESKVGSGSKFIFTIPL